MVLRSNEADIRGTGLICCQRQPEFDEDTFKTSTLGFGLASFTICSTCYGNTMKRALETSINCGSILCS